MIWVMMERLVISMKAIQPMQLLKEFTKMNLLPGFTVLRELLYTKGIECYNASINSKLDVFPKS